jgi:hypothetical protein
MGFAPVSEWSNTHIKTLSIYFDYHEKDKYARYVPENYILCLRVETCDEINRESLESAIQEAIEKLRLVFTVGYHVEDPWRHVLHVGSY